MTALSSGHLATDLAQGALPALLPFLTTRFDLSYTMVGALVLAATISSSLIQPAFGLWSDARRALWLLPTGVAVAGLGMAFASIAPSYALVMLGVLVSGIGVAAYHPEGSKFASYVSGSRRATGMSLFSVGGNVGFALGPLLASFFVITLGLGLDGGVLLGAPGAAGRGPAPRRSSAPGDLRPGHEALARRAAAGNNWWGLSMLHRDRRPAEPRPHGPVHVHPALRDLPRQQRRLRNPTPRPLPLRGRGRHADRRQARRPGRSPSCPARVSFVVSTPLILVYALVGGVVGVVALTLSGAAVIGTFGVSLVMSQEYMPGRVGMASGPLDRLRDRARRDRGASRSVRSPTRSTSRPRS